jgi:hypothetical protein
LLTTATTHGCSGTQERYLNVGKGNVISFTVSKKVWVGKGDRTTQNTYASPDDFLVRCHRGGA